MAASTVPARLWVAGFLAGALAVLVAHQPMLALLDHFHLASATIYSTRPTAPLHVPQVLSLAFWGGVWGIVFAWVQTRFPRQALYWVLAFVFGAILPTLVAWYVVAPIKGLPIPHFSVQRALVPVLANGAWGLGTAIILRALVRG